MYSMVLQLVYHFFSIDSISKWLYDSINTIDSMVCHFCAKLDYQRLLITFWEHKITIYRFNFWKKAKVRRHLYNGTQHCSMFIRELCPLRFSILSQCSRFKTLKIRQKLGFKKFCVFFRLKPFPDHGLPSNVKFSNTAFLVLEPFGVGRTDGQTDGRRSQFPGPLYDNHPFGVDKMTMWILFMQEWVYVPGDL